MHKKPSWHDEARALHDQGFTATEVARRLGRTQASVWKALNPERAAAINRKANAKRRSAKREWDRAHAAPKTKVDVDPEIPGLLPVRSRQGDWFNITDFARVDIEDWLRLRSMRFSRVGDRGYVACQIDGTRFYLHHLILERHSGLECDHINRDPMDNRRANLRLVTRKQNNRNRGGIFEKDAA